VFGWGIVSCGITVSQDAFFAKTSATQSSPRELITAKKAPGARAGITPW
jgi:hypothetical protein